MESVVLKYVSEQDDMHHFHKSISAYKYVKFASISFGCDKNLENRRCGMCQLKFELLNFCESNMNIIS